VIIADERHAVAVIESCPIHARSSACSVRWPKRVRLQDAEMLVPFAGNEPVAREELAMRAAAPAQRRGRLRRPDDSLAVELDVPSAQPRRGLGVAVREAHPERIEQTWLAVVDHIHPIGVGGAIRLIGALDVA